MKTETERRPARGRFVIAVVVVLVLAALFNLRGCEDESTEFEAGQELVDRKRAFAIAKEFAISESDKLEGARYWVISDKDADSDLWHLVIAKDGRERHIWVSRRTGEIVDPGPGR